MKTTTWLRKLVGGAKAARAAGKAPRATLTCEPLEDRRVPSVVPTLDVTNHVLTYTSGNENNNLTAGLDNANPTSATNYIFCDQNENITLTANATSAGWVYADGTQGQGSPFVEGPRTSVNSIVINTGSGNDTITLGLNGNLTIPVRGPGTGGIVFVGAAADAAIIVRGDSTTPVQDNHTISVLGEILAPTGDVELDAQNITVAANQSILTADRVDTGSGNITLNANVTSAAFGNVTVAANATLATGNVSHSANGGGDSGGISISDTTAASAINLNGSLRTGNQGISGFRSGNITATSAVSSGGITVNGTLATGTAVTTSGSVALIEGGGVIVNGSVSTGAANGTSGSIGLGDGSGLGGGTNGVTVGANASVLTGATPSTAGSASGNITLAANFFLDVEGSVQTGNSSHSGSVALNIASSINTGLNLTLNGTVATGSATQVDTNGSDTPASGSITVSDLGGPVVGNGTLTTGNASLTAPSVPAVVPADAITDNDVVTSGSISVTGALGVGLSASPASLVTGTASRTATPAAGIATAGSISITASNGTISSIPNNATLPLNLTIGAASGAATNTAGLLTASASGDMNIAATGALTAGNVSGHNVTLSAAGPLTVGDGSGTTETVRSGTSGSFALSAAGNGVAIATNGVLSGSGAVGTLAVNDALTNAGAVRPGGTGAAGSITVHGNYTQVATGTLYAELGGTTAGTTFDQLAVTGTAQLGGTLDVTLINSFSPSNGNRFGVLAFNGRLAGPNNLPSDFAAKNFHGQTFQAAYNGGYNATLLTLEFVTGAASDVTASTSVRRGGAFVNTATKHITQTLTVTNTSGGTISGPIYLALNIPSSNFHLANAAGVTVLTSPAGQPYVVLSLDDLAAGASLSFTLDFTYSTTPAGFGYTARVLAGGNP